VPASIPGPLKGTALNLKARMTHAGKERQKLEVAYQHVEGLTRRKFIPVT